MSASSSKRSAVEQGGKSSKKVKFQGATQPDAEEHKVKFSTMTQEDMKEIMKYHAEEFATHEEEVAYALDAYKHIVKDRTLNEYSGTVWNKTFAEIIDSNFYKTLVRPKVVRAVVCLFSNNDVQNKDTFWNFLEAGLHNKDFVQAKMRDPMKKYKTGPTKTKCVCCSRNIDRDDYCNVTTFMLEQESSTTGKFRKLTWSMDDYCSGKMEQILVVYHMLWEVSKPLAGYDHQGFALLRPTEVTLGSPLASHQKNALEFLVNGLDNLVTNGDEEPAQ